MDIEAIEFLCQKLGTTVDKLVPAAIEFGKHDAEYSKKVGIIILLFGVICFIIAILISHHDRKSTDIFEDHFIAKAILIICSIFSFGISSFFLVNGVIEAHYWSAFPEMKAYQMLLGWLKG